MPFRHIHRLVMGTNLSIFPIFLKMCINTGWKSCNLQSLMSKNKNTFLHGPCCIVTIPSCFMQAISYQNVLDLCLEQWERKNDPSQTWVCEHMTVVYRGRLSNAQMNQCCCFLFVLPCWHLWRDVNISFLIWYLVVVVRALWRVCRKRSLHFSMQQAL